jgi:Pyruvate/2-oxoacid:ferredoxin oxidoreductase gamma subunit
MIPETPKVFDNISQSLGVDFTPSQIKDIVVPPKPVDIDKKIESDFEYARQNLRELIEKGKSSLDNAISLADSLDQPRGFEVVSAFAKQLAEMNKDLMELHNQKKAAEKEKITVNNNTTNAIYVGSTSDLQDLVNESRSRRKALDTNGEERQ